MFQNADEAKKFIADEDVKFVDVRFCDLPGVMVGPGAHWESGRVPDCGVMQMQSRFRSDRRLTVRMTVTMFLLGLLYVAFVVALIVVLKSWLLVVGLLAMAASWSPVSSTSSSQ